MRRLNFMLTAAATMMFAGCANDVTVAVGDEGEAVEEVVGTAIGFGFSVPNQTRATYSGSDAAGRLNNEFVVFGTKHAAAAEDGTKANDNVVFENYKIVYDANTAGTSETNTNNWEYVGKTTYAESKVKPSLGDSQNQTVKYWDYSAANGYTFTAFAAKEGLSANGNVALVEKLEDDPNATEGATKSKYNKGYKITLKSNAPATTLDGIYFSDRKEVAKTEYNKPVVLTFRNFGSRVRVGFYETVPGYSVKIDKFYFATEGQTAVTEFTEMTKASTDAFKAALLNVGTSTTGNALTVAYKDVNSDIENQPTVTNTTVTYSNTLTLGSGITSATSLGETSVKPTWDSSNGAYTTVYPNEACSNPMLLRCDYTLTSIDGSKEQIKVKNARVAIPAEYCRWKPNFTYTYLFKISDKTNGRTGDDDTDPEGLFPITFDASVVDVSTGNQEIISTISSNSVITYANGSKVVENGEYKANEEIYVVDEKTSDHTVIKPADIGDDATKAQVYKLNQSTTEGQLYAQLNGAKLGITTTPVNDASVVTSVPLADGTSLGLDAVKFKPTEEGTYAYVYTTKKYEATTYTAAGNDYSASTAYYFKTADSAEGVNDGVYYAASGISADNFETYRGKLYVVDAQGKTGVYDIKIIKVKTN